MNLPGLADLGLAGLVLVLAVVPAALVLLVISSLLEVYRLDSRLEARLGHRAYRLSGFVLAAVVIGFFGWMSWGWSAATHLKPLCLARAEPVYWRDEPVAATALSLDVTTPEPGWTRDLAGPGSFAGFNLSATGTPGSVVLRVRRRTVEDRYWTRISADRFQVFEQSSGEVLAEGDELWIDAGRRQYRCGIASGPLPVRGADYPATLGIRRFLLEAARPPGAG